MYERSRPGYPAAAVEWLAQTLELGPGARVVDLGAGTGKLTRQLAALGATVTAVEPVREMREVLERVLPHVTAVDGTAEAIPLEDASADAVTVAQAFHWFDWPRALAELQRVLRPGGGLALVWNVRDEEHALHRAYSETLRPYRGGDYPAQEATAEHLEASDRFERHERRAFRNVQLLDADGLVARAASVSFVAGLPEAERAQLLERIRVLAPPGEFEFPYVTKVFTARSRPLGQNRSS